MTDGDTATCAQPTAPQADVDGLALWSVHLETRQHIYDVFVYYGDNGRERRAVVCLAHKTGSLLFCLFIICTKDIRSA